MKNPADVLRALGRAFAAGDADGMAALCTEHQQTISEHFGEWAESAAAVDDPGARQVSSLLLQLVAEMFADAGRPELLAKLGEKGAGETLH